MLMFLCVHWCRRVGPLDGDIKYEVSAVREGYVFTKLTDRFGHFQSFKLAEILVEVSSPLYCDFDIYKVLFD